MTVVLMLWLLRELVPLVWARAQAEIRAIEEEDRRIMSGEDGQ